jgi:hypothetical protein
MQCERHGLAAGPDGKCALCHREARAFDHAVARQHDRARKVSIQVVSVVVGIFVFVALTAIFDTRR